jgi:ribonuclease BN (tRNA processing enzyme)
VLLRALVLGSGGAIPNGRRETSSLLLLGQDSSDEALVVDAGTGLRRLLTDPSLLEGRSRLTVLLTHFHPDHICGLAYLSELSIACRVIGPGMALHGTSTHDVLDRHYGSPVLPSGVANLGDGRVGIDDYEPGEFTAGSVTVRARVQENHPGRTIGLRFGDDLVWCTDTEADAATAEFARGARVLAHESWFPAHSGHTLPSAAAQIAVDAGVQRLVLIHVPPHITDDGVLREPAAAVHDNVVVATDELDLV